VAVGPQQFQQLLLHDVNKVVSQVKRAELEISGILIGGKRTTATPICRCNSERQYFLSKPQKLEE
jgi:hypothetical protein